MKNRYGRNRSGRRAARAANSRVTNSVMVSRTNKRPGCIMLGFHPGSLAPLVDGQPILIKREQVAALGITDDIYIFYEQSRDLVEPHMARVFGPANLPDLGAGETVSPEPEGRD